MIRSKLPEIMFKHKDRSLAALAKKAGVNRTAVTALYNDDWQSVRKATIDAICRIYECLPGDLFEYIPREVDVKPKKINVKPKKKEGDTR